MENKRTKMENKRKIRKLEDQPEEVSYPTNYISREKTENIAERNKDGIRKFSAMKNLHQKI